ncbi:MAG TPA: hypothetical protein VGV57_04775 [Thermoleophilaceae bacterium]|nr:hypothetical protein [Thermoleophilaceae bacterium]
MSRVRTVLRFVASVLMVSGALLVLDATTASLRRAHALLVALER